jgi:hypothetical protein
MAGAQVVTHPFDWTHSGHREINSPSERYRIINLQDLSPYADLPVSPIFNKRTAEAVVAAFALENSRILSWNDLN